MFCLIKVKEKCFLLLISLILSPSFSVPLSLSLPPSLSLSFRLLIIKIESLEDSGNCEKESDNYLQTQ